MPEPREIAAGLSRHDCYRCWQDANDGSFPRMFLCPECGNKRCPKASDHRLPCSGSNEPGQEGSIYAVRAVLEGE